MHTLILIFLWTILVLFTIAAFILTFFYGRSTIKDNPKKALIFIKTGKHISKPIKGTLAGKPNQTGCRFNYSNKTIFVSNKYGDYYYNNKRMLFLNHFGQLVAMPFSEDISLTNDEKAELIYELCASHIGADSMKALKGKQSFNVIIIGVVAFILGVIAVFGYNYISDAIAQQQVTQQPAKQQQRQPAIEVK